MLHCSTSVCRYLHFGYVSAIQLAVKILNIDISCMCIVMLSAYYTGLTECSGCGGCAGAADPLECLLDMRISLLTLWMPMTWQPLMWEVNPLVFQMN